MFSSSQPLGDKTVSKKQKPALERQEATISAPGSVPDPLRDFDQRLIVHLRRLLNSQPMLRLDWDTQDFFQELSSRYLLRLSAKKPLPSPNSDHETALLKRLARHLFVDQIRRLRAQKRDVVRIQQMPEHPVEKPQMQEPSHLDRMIQVEALEKLRKQVTEDEWEILRLHSEGFGWVDIAAALGRKPSAVRMQHNRLLARLADSLGR